MKWLEVIHLRSAEQDPERLTEFLDQIIDEINGEEGGCKVSLYGRANLKNDVCLQLHHSSEQVRLSGSRLGLHLTMALKTFGMVNHTVWVAAKRDLPR